MASENRNVNLEERKNRKKLFALTSKTQFCNTSLIRLYLGSSGATDCVPRPNSVKINPTNDNKGIRIANSVDL